MEPRQPLRSRLAICFWKTARIWPVAASQMSLAALPSPTGGTVSIDQTQCLRCVAGSASHLCASILVAAAVLPQTCRSRAATRSLQAFRSSTDTDAVQASAALVSCESPAPARVACRIAGFTHNRVCGAKILHVAASSHTVSFLRHAASRVDRFCFWHGGR